MKHVDIKEEEYWKKASSRRKYVSIYWKCCHVFSRIYRNREKTHYEGNCPSCGRRVAAPIGKGGTSRRIFFAN